MGTNNMNLFAFLLSTTLVHRKERGLSNKGRDKIRIEKVKEIEID